MNTITEGPVNQVERISPPNDDVRATVDQMEKIVRLAPLVILAVLVGLPMLSSLLSGSIGGARSSPGSSCSSSLASRSGSSMRW